MAKDPVLPLYFNDFDRSTRDWTDEEVGAYIRLLMEQWDKGSLPKDYQRLTRLATSLNTTWPTIKVKFEEVDGVLKNPNMELIRAKINAHKQKQRENVNKRYQNSTKHATKNLPLEEEKENEKEIELDKEEKGVQGERKDFRYGFQRPGQPPEYFTHVWEYMQENFPMYWEQTQMRHPNFKEWLKEFEEQNLQKMWKDPGDLRDHFKNFLTKKETIKNNSNVSRNNNTRETNASKVGSLLDAINDDLARSSEIV